MDKSKKFRQPNDVRNVLAQHLNKHAAGALRIMMLNARGDLLLMTRVRWFNQRTRTRLMVIESCQVVPVGVSWKPALIAANHLRAPMKKEKV